jgi:phage baseplate assembly protein gpV
MRQLMAYERRLQDLETKLANSVRYVDISDVKHENNRWYVKTKDGDGDNTTFNSDWLPWASFGHGTINVSMPPRKGMKARIVSPNGEPEMGAVEPFHHSKTAKSPHDKQDEVVMTVQSEDGKDSVKIHHSKDGTTVTVGDTVWKLTKDTATLKAKNFVVESDSFKVTSKTIDFIKG